MKARTIRGFVLSVATLLVASVPSVAFASTASGNLGVSAEISAACIVSSESESLEGSDLADPSVTATCTQGTNLVITYARIGSTGAPSVHAAAESRNSLSCSRLRCDRPTYVWADEGTALVTQLDVVVANLTF